MKQKSKNSARVVEIIDGDSLIVSVNGKEKSVCLANVDPLGDEDGRSKNFLKKLLKVDRRISLEEFGENDDGETIANVYKGRKPKGNDIGFLMVKKGFAEIDDDMEYRSDLERLAKMERKAQRGGKGIWSEFDEDDTDDIEELDDSIEDEGGKDHDRDDGVHSSEDLLAELEQDYIKSSKKLEKKLKKLAIKLDQADIVSEKEDIESRIEKLQGKLEQLEVEYEIELDELDEEASEDVFGKARNKLEEKFSKASSKLEKKLEKLGIKFDRAESAEDKEDIEAKIQKIQGKLEELAIEYEIEIEDLEEEVKESENDYSTDSDDDDDGFDDNSEDYFEGMIDDLEDELEELEDKLDDVDNDAEEQAIEARIAKLEEEIDRLDDEYEESLEYLDDSDEVTGRGMKASGNPFDGLEIVSAELDDDLLLVTFSDDVTFQKYDEKSFKAFAGGQKLDISDAEIIDSDLVTFDVPRRFNLSDDSLFKLRFVGSGKGEGDFEDMSQESSTLVAVIDVI